MNLEESSDTKIRVQLDVINEVREQELQSLAELINEQLGSASKQTSIDDVMTTLLEPLAVVQGANGAAQEVQTWVHEGVDEHQWPDTLNEIVNSISDSLKKLDQEKRELESFIVNVTEQLGA